MFDLVNLVSIVFLAILPSSAPYQIQVDEYEWPSLIHGTSMGLVHRKLESFSTLNNIFSQITLDLPDSTISSNGLDLTITELICSDVQVGDIQVGHTSLSDTTTRVAINILGLEVTCNFRWSYKWTIFNGSGSGQAVLGPSSQVSVNLDFVSTDYNVFPPKDVNINDCKSELQIGDLDFEGDGLGFIASIINLFEGLLRDRIEGEIDTSICSGLKGLGDGVLDEILVKISTVLEEYINLSIGLDPLLLENSLSILTDDSGHPLYLNFLELQNYAGEWINTALEKLDNVIGGTESSGEMGINTFLRDTLLDANGQFVLDPSDLMNSNTIFQSNDMLTETIMSIESIAVIGLDTFTELDLLNAIGNYTLQNSMKLDNLTFVLGMRAYMKASTQSDAVISAPDSAPIEEFFSVELTLKNIQIDFSVLLAINNKSLGNSPLGQMLNADDIITCIMGAAEQFSFTHLGISVGDVVPPILRGFLDPGIDKIMSKGAIALFDMYEKVLLSAMPAFFQTSVREQLNAYIDDALRLFNGCEYEGQALNNYIDFRDLFLVPEVAFDMGGSGKSPYGNVINWMYDLVETELFTANEDGLLKINDILVRPFTKLQSGEEGTYHINQTLLELSKSKVDMDVWRAFADKLRLGFYNLRITGLDSFREPFHILKPSNSSGHFLGNQISIGSKNESVDALITMDIEVGGVNSPLATSNTIDLRVSFSSIQLFLDIFAMVEESSFITMPLKDMLKIECWTSMIASSQISSSDVASSSQSSRGLYIQHFDALIEGFKARTSCRSCSNRALEDFDEILQFLDENDFLYNVRLRGISILSELVEGKWMQGVIDSWIQAASYRCPSHPSFRANASSFGVDIPPFKASRQLVDGIIYSGMSTAQIIAIVLAQKQSNREIAAPSIMALDVPKNTTVIDWTNLTNVAGWADMILNEAVTYLGNKRINNDGGQDIGIVNILQSSILNEDGILTIPIIDEGFEAGGVIFSLYNVSLIGLNSFESFDVLNRTGPQGFSNHVFLKELGVSVQMGLSVNEDNASDFNMLETITSSLILKDVDLKASFFMAMDEGVLMRMKLGSIMKTKNIFFCILSAILSVGLSEFVMQVGDIDQFSLSGFVTDATNESIKMFTKSVFSRYKAMVIDSIPVFTSTTVRALLHNIFQVLVTEGKSSGSCPDTTGHDTDGSVDFRDLFLSESRAIELGSSGGSPYGDLFRALFSFVEKSTASTGESGLSSINDLISRLTQKDDIYWPGDVFQRDMMISLNGLNAEISFALRDVRLSNLESVGVPVMILQPVKGKRSVLNNSASIGVGPDPFRVSFTLFISGVGEELQVSNEVELGLSLSSVKMLMEILIEMKELSLLNFPLHDIASIDCWLAAVSTPLLDKYGVRVEDKKSFSIDQLEMVVKEAQLDMTCISCSSPILLEMSSFFQSAEGLADTTEVANMLLSYGSSLLRGDFFQNLIDRALNDAAKKCPHSSLYDPGFSSIKYDDLQSALKTNGAYGFLIAILSVITVMIVLAAVMMITAKFVTRRRHRRWVNQLNRSQVMQLVQEEANELLCQTDLNKRMNALVSSHESVPSILRFGMPIVILGNIALFLSGHLSLGGTVNISGAFAGESFDVQGFFEFSMAKSTIEMWEAGAHSLAILIVIFSGVWPYTKQLMILLLWFLPPSRLSSKRRGQILHWLDVLGKWSMVDVFVLLMSLASFRITVESPSHLKFLPEDLFEIQMMVIPLWGLYANMLAQIVSQISSHVIIYYHRKTVTAAIHSQEIEWNMNNIESHQTCSRKVLCKHHFRLDYEAATDYAVVRTWISRTLIFFFLAIASLVICGCSIPSFSIEIVGILGLAVESMNEFKEAIVYYSVFDLSKLIMDQARYLNTASNYIGLAALSSLLVVTVFLVPLFQAVSLFIEWFVPMDERQRKRNRVVIEILSAWQYMEVYVLSVVIAAWQLGGVSEYMINAYCDSLENFFTAMSFYGILNESDAQCFRVNATVVKASWILVAASVLLSIVNHFVTSASSQMNNDTSFPSQSRFHSDRWLTTKPTLSSTMSENTVNDETQDMNVSPVSPRFTDFYSFATTRESQQRETNEMKCSESNCLGMPSFEVSGEVETAAAFWDVPLDGVDSDRGSSP